MRALQSADVILHEAGVAPAVLGLGRREARRIPAPGDPEAGAAAVLALAAEGRTVAWVGPGDPATCRAWTARAARLRDGGFPLETVKGLRCGPCPDGCAAPGGTAWDRSS